MNSKIIIKKVRELIVIATLYSWNHYIKERIQDNTDYEIEDFDEEKMAFIDYEIIKVLKSLVNNEKYYTFSLITKTFEERRVLDYSLVNTREHLSCDSSKISYQNFRKTKFEEIMKKILVYHSSLIHPIFGIFKGHYRGIADSMPLIAVDAKLGRRSYDAYGRASSYNESYYTGVLEALERFHGVAPQDSKTIIMSEDELKKLKMEYLPMKKFNHYGKENYELKTFEFNEYSSKKKIRWRSTFDYNKKREVLIPEQIIYFSNEQFYKDDSEERYIAETSNGTAIGSTWEEAAIVSLMEVIERDSFLVHWYTKSPPIKLDNIESYPDTDIQLMLAYLEMIDYKVHLFDITLESRIPAYWVLLEYKGDNDENLAFYTAAGANINPIAAIKSALIEAATSIKVFKAYMYKKYTESELLNLKRNYLNVNKLEDHLYLFSSKEMRKHLEFALNTPKHTDIVLSIQSYQADNGRRITQGELLEELLNRITQNHKEIFISDLSNAFLRDMGLSCTKIHIPTLQNIGFGMQYQNINRDRLEQAVKINKLEGDFKVLTNVPHPFP
ncbi:YcaO-like family protein [Bacillus cytotoxicus]|uniref:YcaO-like family protein n=1 Tax=Bacillus cytotoxicus TaxID=580165 RepID=UPI0035C9AEA0